MYTPVHINGKEVELAWTRKTNLLLGKAAIVNENIPTPTSQPSVAS